MYQFPISVRTNYQRCSGGFKQYKFVILPFCRSEVQAGILIFMFWISQGCHQSVCHQGFSQEALGRIDFFAHSMLWQNPVPCAGGSEFSLTLLAISWEPLLVPRALSPVSYIAVPEIVHQILPRCGIFPTSPSASSLFYF